MKKERSNIQLSSYDDIFGDDASAGNSGAVNGDTVVDIPLDELHSFRNHPFKVRDDVDMEKRWSPFKSLVYCNQLLFDQTAMEAMKSCQDIEDIMPQK